MILQCNCVMCNGVMCNYVMYNGVNPGNVSNTDTQLMLVSVIHSNISVCLCVSVCAKYLKKL